MRNLFVIVALLSLFACTSTESFPERDACLDLFPSHVSTEEHVLLSRLSTQAALSLSLRLKKSFASLDDVRVSKIPISLSFDLDGGAVGVWLAGFYDRQEFLVSAPCNDLGPAGLIFVTLANMSDKWRVVARNAKDEILFVLEEPVN